MRHYIDQGCFERLKAYARNLSIYYHSPVYIVGSAIRSSGYRDVDVIVVMPEKYFEARYGSIEDFKKGYVSGYGIVSETWKRDCEKNWYRMATATGLNIDFKIMPAGLFHTKEPAIRIDTI